MVLRQRASDTRRKRLEIRSRDTLLGDGDTAGELTVFCPVRGESVLVDECSSCSQCHGISVDPAGRKSFIVCDSVGQRLAAEGWYRDLGSGTTSDPHRVAIGELMTRDVICVTPEVSLEALRALLVERGISGIPVVDERGRPLGIVSKTDLVREDYEAGDTVAYKDAELSPEDRAQLDPVGGFHVVSPLRATAGEIMMPFSMSLPETASVARAAALMAYEGVHRLPVVSVTGTVIGILSSFDVLRWLAETAGFDTGRRHTGRMD